MGFWDTLMKGHPNCRGKNYFPKGYKPKSNGFFTNKNEKTYEEHKFDSGSSLTFHPFNIYSMFRPDGNISKSEFESHKFMEEMEDINLWMEEDEKDNCSSWF